MVAGLSAAVLGVATAADSAQDAHDLGGFDEPRDDDLGGFDSDDDDLGGFEDGDAENDPLDDTGFDEADSDDGGFEDEFDSGELPRDAPTERFWELTGSTSLGSSINYLDHESATGTQYQGLARLRTRLNLQLDIDLPAGWRGRVSGFGFYDWAYLANGRHQYTRDVLNAYEWEVDVQEAWVQGSLAKPLDLKIGRQIVNWGRSDTLRVLDVLNPLDNREPGLTDIEDLRRPVVMAKADAFYRAWTLSLIAIPEIRFSKNPPIGSDFAPIFSSLGTLESFVAPDKVPSESFDNTGWAAALGGVFSGWDISFHFARLWADAAHLRPVLSGPIPSAGTETRHSRFTLVGSGANYTIGSWLVKTELAWLDGLDYTTSTRFAIPTAMGPISTQIPSGTTRKSRLDFMMGVEYYGLADTNIVVEVANRHIFGFREKMRPNFNVERNALETAVRITRNFMNDRLAATLVAIAFGNHAQHGSIVRFDLGYDLRDSLVLGAGILLFQDGDRIPFNTISRNDRFFFEIKYSF